MQFTELSDALPAGSAYISCCLRSHFSIRPSAFTVLDIGAAQLGEVSVTVESDLGGKNGLPSESRRIRFPAPRLSHVSIPEVLDRQDVSHADMLKIQMQPKWSQNSHFQAADQKQHEALICTMCHRHGTGNGLVKTGALPPAASRGRGGAPANCGPRFHLIKS